jgi:hypothetical protein
LEAVRDISEAFSELSQTLEQGWIIGEAESILSDLAGGERVVLISKQDAANAVTKATTGLEKMLTNQSNRAYTRAVDQSLSELAKRGGTGPWKKSDITFFNKRLTANLAKEMRVTAAQMKDPTSAIYKLSRVGAAGQLGFTPRLTDVDKRIQGFLAKDSAYWMNNTVKNIQPRIHNISAKIMANPELSRKQSALALRKGLLSDVGIRGRDVVRPPGVIIPPGWKGSLSEYYNGLTQNIQTRANGFAKITTYETAGIQNYRIAAIIDNRTSDVCRLMDGTVFPVAAGARLRDRILNMKNPQGIRKTSGWRTAPQIKKLGGRQRGGKFGKKGTAKLSAAGLGLPSYHFRCRTDIEPVGEVAAPVLADVSGAVLSPISGPFQAVARTKLNKMDLGQLRGLARERKLKYFRAMNETELRNALANPNKATEISKSVYGRWRKKWGRDGKVNPPPPLGTRTAKEIAKLEKKSLKQLQYLARRRNIANSEIMTREELIKVLGDPKSRNTVQKAVQPRVTKAKKKPGKTPGTTQADDLGLVDDALDRKREIDHLYRNTSTTITDTSAFSKNNLREKLDELLAPYPTDVIKEFNRRNLTLEFVRNESEVAWRGTSSGFGGLATGGPRYRRMKMAVVERRFLGATESFMDGTFHHEVGHLIDYAFKATIRPGGERPSSFVKLNKLLNGSFKKQMNVIFPHVEQYGFSTEYSLRQGIGLANYKGGGRQTLEGVYSILSPYSCTNKKEFFAECLKDYSRGGNTLKRLYPKLYDEIKTVVYRGYEFPVQTVSRFGLPTSTQPRLLPIKRPNLNTRVTVPKKFSRWSGMSTSEIGESETRELTGILQSRAHLPTSVVNKLKRPDVAVILKNPKTIKTVLQEYGVKTRLVD